ncbi:MAG: hypothetical protein OJF49_003221 [Ktedonobacterales bacterium]|nr:MAG: hypothetical protein OJF49_003221 [Ktedonobacterales bacterium]
MPANPYPFGLCVHKPNGPPGPRPIRRRRPLCYTAVIE